MSHPAFKNIAQGTDGVDRVTTLTSGPPGIYLEVSCKWSLPAYNPLSVV